MSSEKRKIAYIDGKPYEIGSNHTSILKFVKSYLGEKVPTLCDDPNLHHMVLAEFALLKLL